METRCIWDGWGKTDPGATRQVSAGRKFTAIDAYWKFEKLTEMFGPVGKGWGWQVHSYENAIVGDDVLVICRVSLWWKDAQGEANVYPDGQGTPGTAFLLRKGRVDNDAHKKAQTDAVTKAASFLGLGHDVFRGRFDDNKYVEEAGIEHRAKQVDLDSEAAERGIAELRKFLESRLPEEKVEKSIEEVVSKPVSDRAKHARYLLLKAKEKLGPRTKPEIQPGKRPF